MTCTFIFFYGSLLQYLQIDSSKQTTEDDLKPPGTLDKLKVLRLQVIYWVQWDNGWKTGNYVLPFT